MLFSPVPHLSIHLLWKAFHHANFPSRWLIFANRSLNFRWYDGSRRVADEASCFGQSTGRS